MIIVSGHLRVAPAERAAYLEGSRAVIEAARRAPGCLDFHLSPDPIDDDRINVVERFRGAGPSGDQQAAIIDARVAQHEVASTTPL